VAAAGVPTVERPGPEFPADVQKTSSGFSRKTLLKTSSMSESPSISDSTPKERLQTNGTPLSRAKRAAYAIAFFMLSVTLGLPSAPIPIFRPMTCAPGATPLKSG
jgi:hypothetical protein